MGLRPAKINAARRSVLRADARLAVSVSDNGGAVDVTTSPPNKPRKRCMSAKSAEPPATVRYPLNLVQDIASAAFLSKIVDQAFEGAQVGRPVVNVHRTGHEHQSGVARRATVHVTVDAFRLNDGIGNVVLVDLFGSVTDLGKVARSSS